MDCKYDNVQSRRVFCLRLATLSSAGMFTLPALAACFADSSTSGKSKSDITTDMSNTNTKIIHDDFEPGYLKLYRTGELRARAEVMWDMMKACRLCPRECEKDRIRGQKGEYCNATSRLRVSSYNPHFGEEKPLVGRNGSGTVFFTNCALLCVFCINWEISQGGVGRDIEIRHLSNMMLRLQEMGCHNINLVTPTHYSPHILLALDDAASRGLSLPLVYNTSGWERMEILNLLNGVVDIYLSDFKYFEPMKADIYSPGAFTYPEDTKLAVLEMNRQVGVADPSENQGLLRRGLIIRHLVMPNNAGGTDELLGWIASNLPKNTYVNLMSQYRPAFNASDYPEISRGLQVREYRKAIDTAIKAGLTNLDIQGNR